MQESLENYQSNRKTNSGLCYPIPLDVNSKIVIGDQQVIEEHSKKISQNQDSLNNLEDCKNNQPNTKSPLNS